MSTSPAPVHRIVGRFLTCHTWSKINKRDLNCSDWYCECIKPLLEGGRIMPKKFMLYCDASHPHIWRLIMRDYHDLYAVSIAAMDAKAAYKYAKTLYARKNQPTPKITGTAQETCHGE